MCSPQNLDNETKVYHVLLLSLKSTAKKLVKLPKPCVELFQINMY